MQDERVRWLAKAEEMRKKHVAFVKSVKVDAISLQKAFDDSLPQCFSAQQQQDNFLEISFIHLNLPKSLMNLSWCS